MADIFRAHGPAWRRANAGHVSRSQLKVMSAIEACRTEALGGHVAGCAKCGHHHVAYNSCKNRHCPKCQGPAARDWMAACLYAHEDKLDAECDGAIGDYGDLMDAVFERIRFATQECRAELAQLCMDESGVADGPLTCLAAKSSELSDGCRSAVERLDALED